MKRGRPESPCRSCYRLYSKRYYAANKEKWRAYYEKSPRYQQLQENYANLIAYLIAHPCVDCGEADPIVLEFDHVRGVKQFNIGEAISRGGAWDLISAEIEKCDVRCANCHRRKTTRECGWYRGKF